jgi:glycosyltransferase involved in cell wall biosynthesis
MKSQGRRRPVSGKRPTICHLLHSLRVGGAEVLAARLARQLAGSFQFLFVCLDELGSLGGELREEGFPVRVLERKPGLDWGLPRRLAALWRREGVDLIHAHQYTPFFYAMLARFLYRRPPVMFTEHGRHYPDYPRRKRIMANRLLLQRRDRVVGVGEAVRQALIANEGIPAERVSVIYNGIDFSSFAPDAAGRLAIRQELGLGATDLMIVQVARLDYLKDHVTAIRALERVVQSRTDARLVLVGEGPERDAIQEQVNQRNLGPYVRLLGLRADVGRLLAAADLFLLTSISEGIPLTVIEAMAAGLPVVSTQVGGLSEMIDHGTSGFLAPAGDAEALARGILSVADNPQLRKQMGRLGQERAFRVFSEELMHTRYVALYQKMLRG